MKTADTILKELADLGNESAKELLEKQNLMLTLHDACEVMYRFLDDHTDFFHKNSGEAEELFQILFQSFEQKCYIGKPLMDLDYALSEITPQSIAEEIANDRLGEWCINMQVLLQMQMADAIAKGK